MQSPAQEDSGPNPLRTQTTLDNETSSTESASTETDKLLQQAEGKEPAENTETMKADEGPKTQSELTLSTNKDQVPNEEKMKKKIKGFNPRKAMSDPLKMDMTKPVVMPLTYPSAKKYPCSLCKAAFMSLKTMLRHLKAKHNLSPALLNKPPLSGSQLTQTSPLIMPISISQPSMLQLEPHGPLQRVDGNIDTEQIHRLIESLGNIQKVKQVVILGQVPPNAPPLEIQQIPEQSKPEQLYPKPPQLDFTGMTQVDVKTIQGDLPLNSDDPMEQTIILEPITPDGQLINPPFSEFGTHIVSGESFALGFVPDVRRMEAEGEFMHQIHSQPEMNTTYSNTTDSLVCTNEENDREQIITLELTPALTPTAELEQSQNEPNQKISPTLLVPTTELVKTPCPSIETESGSSVPSSVPAVKQNLTYVQSKHDLSYAPTQGPEEPGCHPEVDSLSQIQTEDPGQIHCVSDIVNLQEYQEKTTQDEQSLVDAKQGEDEVESQTEVVDVSSKKTIPSPSHTNQQPQISELPVNVMSAQELVKIRKRKPARALFIQSYMQELIGTILDEDLQSAGKPSKPKKAKKSHLVIKFGPQKEKKNKGNKKRGTPPQSCLSTQDESVSTGETKLPQNKVPSKKKKVVSNKGKKNKNLLSSTDVHTSPLAKVPQMYPTSKEKTKKLKKNEKVSISGVQNINKQKAVLKKKKTQSKMLQKSGAHKSKVVTKERKKKEVKSSPKTSKSRADSTGVQIAQDTLLLLKGHKQPQLKVHKLDPSKTSGQSPEAPPCDQQTQHSKKGKAKRKTNSTNSLNAKCKKKGKQPPKKQKALSLLSFMNSKHQPPETQPAKPKTNRKRKAPSDVHTEGVITSAHSKRALECKNCGEIFSEVASFQMHKAKVHVMESPGLTFTNGNIFEGVSRLDVSQPERVVGLMNPTTGWDTEPEMAMEDKERSVSFPALIPSPSLPGPCADEVSGEPPNSQKHTPTLKLLRNCKASSLNPLPDSNEALVYTDEQQEESTPKNLCSESEIQSTIDGDITQNDLLWVDLVTVVKQNESNSVSFCTPSQNVSNERSNEKIISNAGKCLQSVSCSTEQAQVKEEVEEVLVQIKKKADLKSSTGDRGPTNSHGDVVKGTEMEEKLEDCEVVYEKPCCDSQVRNEAEALVQTSQPAIKDPRCDPNVIPAPCTFLPLTSSTLDEVSYAAPEEQGVFELESASINDELDKESQPMESSSPGIILTKIVTSGQPLANKPIHLMSTCNNQRQGEDCTAAKEVPLSLGIKVEENASDSSLQNESNKEILSLQNQDIRTVLVKEEISAGLNDAQATPDSRHSSSSFTDIEETTRDCHVTPDFSNKQCIFYPVKEEEKDIFLGSDQTNCGSLSTEADYRQTADQTTECNLYEGIHSQEDYQDMKEPEMGVGDIADEQESQNLPELQRLLFQSSDEEDAVSLESPPPYIDCEAEVMAYFHKNGSHQPGVTTQNVIQAPRETRGPIQYFSRYFGWDTWVDIAQCTNQSTSTPNCVTVREVAQFVGIHIAMGTLKFPSSRLYWEDLTKVSLIADAMTLSRFLQLSRVLKLAAKDPVNSNGTEERTCINLQNGLSGDSSHLQADMSYQRKASDDTLDPLWKVLPLLYRFQKGCQSFRREGNYAVDQYLIPLTKEHKNMLALHSTTLIGFGGLLLHVDFKVDLSDKEDVVQKMVPKDSTVFLCKQELSTPAMLERLLAAGIQSAGRVGGARGQIGDEFVSSDGRLMLRRTHCGFILSTAGHSQRNMAILMDNFEKAQTAARLNRDLLNLYSIPISSLPKCWPLTVLWYLTDLALVNSWLLYKHDHLTNPAHLSLMDFRLQVSKALIHSSGMDSQHSVLPQPTSGKTHARTDPPNPSTVEESSLPDAATRYDGSGHWPEQLAEGEGGRCRFGHCQRTSRVLCLKCCVFLCISRNHNCFLNFHNQANSGNL
ncbi:uncharacterized protein LOC133562148 isoform X2 [Nerophis ophidion]|uniref:uncharacterized protein LOC133562148 isoform X2 n=1 Tax=Nerophis ophidion TaxID=159077 RepID=UPI002ADF2A28|nr:uncharacterized protein LOC133562148 isoform X2 [Nerophis ophidion]